MPQVKAASDELDELRDRSVKPLMQGLLEIGRAYLEGHPEEKTNAELAFAEDLGATMALADLFGRRRLLFEIDAHEYAKPASPVTPIIPKVPFKQAVAELVQRDPRLERSAEEVARAYSRERVFAMARSASMEVTRRAQEILQGALATGRAELKVEEAIRQLQDFSFAYAWVVYRTNLSTAYTAGKFRMVEDPGVAQVVKAFRLTAVVDGRTRPNHKAADGIIAAPADPIWKKLAPPLGYACRCVLAFVSAAQLRTWGLLRKDGTVRPYGNPPAGAYADENFGLGRPDLMNYGVRVA